MSSRKEVLSKANNGIQQGVSSTNNGNELHDLMAGLCSKTSEKTRQKRPYDIAEASNHYLSSLSSAIVKTKPKGETAKEKRKHVTFSPISTLKVYCQSENTRELYITDHDRRQFGQEALSMAGKIHNALKRKSDNLQVVSQESKSDFLPLVLALNAINKDWAEEMIGIEDFVCGSRHVQCVELTRKKVRRSVVAVCELLHQESKEHSTKGVGKDNAARKIASFSEKMTKDSASRARRRAAYVRWLNQYSSSLEGTANLNSGLGVPAVLCRRAANAA